MCALLPIPTLTSATGLFHRHLEWNFACESAMMGSAEGVCVEDEHPIVEFKRRVLIRGTKENCLLSREGHCWSEIKNKQTIRRGCYF